MTAARRSSLVGALLLASVGACTAPGGPDKITTGQFPGEGAGGSAAPVIDGGVDSVQQVRLGCTATESSDPLPPRSTIVDSTAAPTQTLYFTSTLFDLFDKVCGSCHVENSLGSPPFKVSMANFSTIVDATVLQVMKSDDANVFMPPSTAGGIPLAQRAPTDPVRELESLLEVWIARGRPPQSFYLDNTNTAQPTTANYEISAAMSASMSNLGTCVPAPQMVATAGDEMDALDTMFAGLTSGPANL